MDFKFPDVGEGLSEGVLVKWLVKVGDSIKKDQPIAQVETDKAVVEIPCPQSGTVSELLFEEGKIMTVGDVMIRLGDEKATEEPVEDKSTEQKVENSTEKSPEKQVEVPKAFSNQTHSKHSSVKALPSVRKYAKEHDIDLASLSASGKHGEVTMDDVSNGAHETIQKHTEEKSHTSKEILATPATRQYARTIGVDITTIQGTGDNGKITNEDVDKAHEGTPVVTPNTPEPSPITAEKLGGERIPLSNIRKIIAKRMIESIQHTASTTNSDQVDVTELVMLQQKEREILKEKGIRLSFLPFIIKATLLALEKYPVFNATLDEKAQEIILHPHYNMGMAVATPKGLIVPVITDANDKSITSLAKEIVDLATRGREGKVAVNELKGSTFSISNIGSIGGQVFTPIINYPEVAILGVGRIQDRAWVVNGEIQIRKILTLSLTFDHRVADGADAAFFLNTIMEYLADPESLFLNMN